MRRFMIGRKTAWLLSVSLIAVMLASILPYRMARAANLDGDLASKIWSITDPSLTSDAWTQELKAVFADKTGITSSTATSGIKWFPRAQMENVSEPWNGQPLFTNSTVLPTLPAVHTNNTAEVVAVAINNGDGTTTTTYTSYTATNIPTVELYTIRTTGDAATVHRTTDEYHVYTGEALRWVMNRFGSNRNGVLYLERSIDLNGQEHDWGIGRICQGQDIYGKDHVLYNLRATNTSDSSRVGFITTTDSSAANHNIIDGLTFQTAYLWNNSTSGNARTAPLAYLYGTIDINNCHSKNVVSVGNQNTAALIGRNDTRGNVGSTVSRCSVENSVVYGNGHQGSLSGCMFNTKYTNCYSVGSVVISTGVHSGGFVSCGNTVKFENCFVDVNLYGSVDTGVFIGSVNANQGDDVNSFTNCFATGFIEGSSRIGGFIGTACEDSSTAIFTDCYSTALVGLQNGGSEMGGFAGRIGSVGNPTLTMTNCYAAGEVGSADINLSGDPVNDMQAQRSGGFIGNCNLGATTSLTFSNCYYDKQTTAMREWAIGVKPTMGTMTGMPVGVLTTDTVKNGNGITSSMSAASTGFQPFPGTAWDYGESEHYPELAVFLNATANTWGNADRAALVKAYSLASTSGVKLSTWDYGLNTATGELYTAQSGALLPETTYCTVRDLTSGFVLTSQGGVLTTNGWIRTETQEGDGRAVAKVTIAGLEYDVLSLKHQNGIYNKKRIAEIAVQREKAQNCNNIVQ